MKNSVLLILFAVLFSITFLIRPVYAGYATLEFSPSNIDLYGPQQVFITIKGLTSKIDGLDFESSFDSNCVSVDSLEKGDFDYYPVLKVEGNKLKISGLLDPKTTNSMGNKTFAKFTLTPKMLGSCDFTIDMKKSVAAYNGGNTYKINFVPPRYIIKALKKDGDITPSPTYTAPMNPTLPSDSTYPYDDTKDMVRTRDSLITVILILFVIVILVMLGALGFYMYKNKLKE